MKKFVAWLDHRTGVKKLTHEALYENIPGGSRWRYIWGSTLSFALVVQFITGLALWMNYSANAQGAWESVFYIQNVMSGGWLLRGIHHYTAQIMTILLALHLMQVVIDGAYKAPREMNFWFGLILLLLTLSLSLTGYLLPWDQKGYWATKVSTNIAGITPIIGPSLQRLIVGGADYGHHTLTRFFALHAGVLPGAIIALLVVHIYLFRRHGITAKTPYRKRDEAFWPEQVLKDAVACLAVMATVLFLIVLPRLRDPHAAMGAELGAPADPSEAFSAARPEWYFLFLFQFLKYFPGESEIIGAMIIPGFFMTVIFAMPFIGHWKFGRRFNVSLLFALLFGAGLLTYLAKNEDAHNPIYQAAVKDAEESSRRIQQLALGGIPPGGALSLLENDPATQGPKLFASRCASCHRYDGHDGQGKQPTDPQSAADLKGFANRDWAAAVLDPQRVATTNQFGGTKFRDGKMVKFVKKDIAAFEAPQREHLAKVVKALSAEAALPSQTALDAADKAGIEEGRALMSNTNMRCTECHQFHKKDEDATAPDLTGWGSHEWLAGIIRNPAHERFYGKRNDRMPAFASEGVLTEAQIELLTKWLRAEGGH